MQLRDDDPLGAVDDERAPLGHIGDRTEIDVLNHHAEILVLVVGAIELEFGLQRHAVRESALEALLDRVAGRVDIIVDKLQDEVVPGIGDGEILLEHLVEPLVLAVLGGGVHLEKIPERFKLHLQQIRVGHPVPDCGEANSLLLFCSGHRQNPLFS